MSVPLTNALSPAPRRIRTFIRGSGERQMSPRRRYIPKVIALRASGRLKVNQAMPSSPTWNRISSALIKAPG